MSARPIASQVKATCSGTTGSHSRQPGISSLVPRLGHWTLGPASGYGAKDFSQLYCRYGTCASLDGYGRGNSRS